MMSSVRGATSSCGSAAAGSGGTAVSAVGAASALVCLDSCVIATPRSFGDGAGIFLIGHHEDQNLRPLIRTWIARGRMHRAGGLIEGITRLQEDAPLPIDAELVGAFHDVTKRMMAGMAMPRAAAPRVAVQEADAHLAARQIGKRLNEDLPGTGGGRRLCGGFFHKTRRAPGCDSGHDCG